MKKSFIILASLAVIAFIVLLLLRPNAKTDQEISADIAATIYPIYDITRSIAGDVLEVGLVLPVGASPHTFEPTPSQIEKLQGASVVYAIGHGFDDWIDPLLETVGAEKRVIDDGITIRPSTDTEEGANDPHYWLTVANAKHIATTIAHDLETRYPESAELFEANLATYLVDLDQTDANIRMILSEIENRHLITLHDAWYYFAQEYGLYVVGTFEPSAGREPTPQYLADLITSMQEADVTTLYTEPQLDTSLLASFLDDYQLTIATLDPLGGTAGSETYIQMMISNAQTLEKNQNGTSTP